MFIKEKVVKRELTDNDVWVYYFACGCVVYMHPLLFRLSRLCEKHKREVEEELGDLAPYLFFIDEDEDF